MNRSDALYLVPSQFTFGFCRKTKPIRAKHITAVLSDRKLQTKMLVDTFEGKEPLGEHVMICLGEAGDCWQQGPNKLVAKYNIDGVDYDGWLLCSPKPDVMVNYKQVNEPNFCIQGSYGETAEVKVWGNGPEPETKTMEKIQFGEAGDYVLQSQQDLKDFWIVKRRFFENTYDIVLENR